MSENPTSGQLGQFLGDLTAIREKRNVSLDALRDATKVYPNIITQFEQDGLVDHPLFNALYVRAFIRSYSAALGISVDDVLTSYDMAREGKYDRRLALEYLDLPAAEVEALKANIAAEEKEEALSSADNIESEQSASEEPIPKKSAVRKPSSRKGASTRAGSKAVSSGQKIEEAAASGAAITFIPKSDDRQTSSLDNLSNGITATLQSLFERGKQSPIFQWGLLTVGITLGLFVIIQLLPLEHDAPEEVRPNGAGTAGEHTPPASGSPDSILTMPAESIDVPQPSVPIVLGDSIPFYIIADKGKLDPFRVKRDQDLRRPYWLNEGDSMLFYFDNRTVIEDNLQNMKILIEGYTYPIYETDSLATVIIDRDSIQAFLASR